MTQVLVILFNIVVLAGIAAVKLLLPAGTEIEIRLQTKVASNTSVAGDTVEAVVIAPVFLDNKTVIAAGTKIHGTIEDVKSTQGKTDERAKVKLRFDEIEDSAGNKSKLSLQITAVDDARESVDEEGQIVGILASETMSARIDQEISKLGERHSALADFLGAVKTTAFKEPLPEIVYEPGVEMTLKVADKIQFEPSFGRKQQPAKMPAYSAEDLSKKVNAQPFQTKAAKLEKPSDVTNLMLLGTREQIEAAFKEAGWTPAAALNRRTGLETVRAIAENRGYKESPVSLLVLDGQAPELVFQKQNNTFAKRHHLRIWRRPDQFLGKTVWVSSATHDTGITFSAENRTFIHTIDSNIDLERAKVTNDLQFTGLVISSVLVERPAVPKNGSNATGDKLLTDGKMAVLFFR
jgi:hypothetical protein